MCVMYVAHQLRNAYLVISSKQLYKVLEAQEVGSFYKSWHNPKCMRSTIVSNHV